MHREALPLPRSLVVEHEMDRLKHRFQPLYHGLVIRAGLRVAGHQPGCLIGYDNKVPVRMRITLSTLGTWPPSPEAKICGKSLYAY